MAYKNKKIPFLKLWIPYKILKLLIEKLIKNVVKNRNSITYLKQNEKI